ncbi:MAG TPA: 3-hydroxyacyl-CoA dehydrogenase NAD-binding domain-containing protein [Flavitalea sp.]|nr:3-hydroxyacyl-CoA dehydrogenase NAD-binding domain-containing protein [Flavitalea sp.]
MIQKISVCGAGTMGRGIALACSQSDYSTILFDADANALANARTSIEQQLKMLESKNKINSHQHEQMIKNLEYTTSVHDCRADLVIEAIIEQADAKEKLFTTLAGLNAPDAILATNTSSLSVSKLAETIPRPERFAGMHFFNPATLMKLVEIVQTPHTSANTVNELREVVRKMSKTPVLCRDAPGFIVNHVARPYYLEALRLLETGIADIETIDAIMEATGFRMGPFRLMDLIGNDINYSVSCSVYKALEEPQRLKPSIIQQKKVQQGELGKKTGKGYYEYDNE